MPKIRIHLDAPGNPFLESRDFEETPRTGEVVFIRGYDGPISYKVKNVFHPNDSSEIIITLHTITTNENQVPAIAKAGKSDIETYSEEMKKVFEQSKAYTNVMILAGYTGLFATWNMIKERLSNHDAGVVAALAGASLFIFVLHELLGALGQGMIHSYENNENSKIAKTGKFVLTVQIKSWFLSFLASVSLGFLAAGKLFWYVVTQLIWSIPTPPTP